KTTRPFLRTSEFLWQEGHTIHETAEEAQEETIKMLNVYADMFRDFLAIPVVKGRKTDKEKFAGAEATYTIEALMHDGKALQSGTSHNFGKGFAEAFGIRYTGKDGKLSHVHQTSWGLSTRVIGAIIMVHGDDSGLILPPRVAPTQLMIIPVAQHKEGVLEKAEELREKLSGVCRVKVDASDKKPGWKFSEYEMKGVPLRLEVGPKDIENNQVVLVRRDTREKMIVSMDELEARIPALLNEIHDALYEKAVKRQEEMTTTVTTPEEMRDAADNKPGFIKAMWCNELACEEKIKEVYGLSSRCMPFEQEKVADTCICCGKETDTMVYWGKAY
ncbi:His/Gly/Thr/Pro-type tRNA ligase C-terminal domain-containing protein, partial [Proteiniclasticum ruminis]